MRVRLLLLTTAGSDKIVYDMSGLDTVLCQEGSLREDLNHK